MKTITLNIPDEIVPELLNIDLLEILKIGLAFYKTSINLETKFNSLSLNYPKIDRKKWEEDLLKASTWTEEEIQEVEKSRGYINQWKPSH
jgi:hypothetical protein